jgi:hypothetical protein
LSRRDRTKVARYEVPGKAPIGQPSRRDGLMGYASGFTIWRRDDGWTRRKSALRKGDATLRTTNHTVPFGTELVSRGYQALRTWLPSFRPSGTTKPQHLSTFFEATSLRSPGFEDSLPDVASRSFRRRGEVGRTTKRTKRRTRAVGLIKRETNANM